ncbi:MAG: hypothetical protein WBA46_15145 [Thermomicrobiales bacterium]
MTSTTSTISPDSTSPLAPSRQASPTPAGAGGTHHVPVQSPFKVRDLNSSSLTEIWLVSAIVTILGIRIYLAATGYPQVGGAKLHVAHMLWGGLGMVVAIGILVIFASDVWKAPAAMIGGAGFGCFIDELGKFITKDNNYFYQPTIALIYAVLVVLFLISRSIDRIDKITPSDHLFYAVRSLEQLAIGQLDRERQQAGLKHLDDSGETGPLADAIRDVLTHATLIETRGPSRLLRIRRALVDRYWKLVAGPWLFRIVIGLFILQTINGLASLILAWSIGSFTITNGLSFTEWGTLLSGFGAALAAAIGLVLLWRNERVRGLKSLVHSTLITLLFGQFFAFASNQFAALGSLVLQLVILGVLRFWIAADTSTSPGVPVDLAAENVTVPESERTRAERAEDAGA